MYQFPSSSLNGTKLDVSKISEPIQLKEKWSKLAEDEEWKKWNENKKITNAITSTDVTGVNLWIFTNQGPDKDSFQFLVYDSNNKADVESRNQTIGSHHYLNQSSKWITSDFNDFKFWSLLINEKGQMSFTGIFYDYSSKYFVDHSPLWFCVDGNMASFIKEEKCPKKFPDWNIIHGIEVGKFLYLFSSKMVYVIPKDAYHWENEARMLGENKNGTFTIKEDPIDELFNPKPDPHKNPDSHQTPDPHRNPHQNSTVSINVTRSTIETTTERMFFKFYFNYFNNICLFRWFKNYYINFNYFAYHFDYHPYSNLFIINVEEKAR